MRRKEGWTSEKRTTGARCAFPTQAGCRVALPRCPGSQWRTPIFNISSTEQLLNEVVMRIPPLHLLCSTRPSCAYGCSSTAVAVAFDRAGVLACLSCHGAPSNQSSAVDVPAKRDVSFSEVAEPSPSRIATHFSRRLQRPCSFWFCAVTFSLVWFARAHSAYTELPRLGCCRSNIS